MVGCHASVGLSVSIEESEISKDSSIKFPRTLAFDSVSLRSASGKTISVLMTMSAASIVI